MSSIPPPSNPRYPSSPLAGSSNPPTAPSNPPTAPGTLPSTVPGLQPPPVPGGSNIPPMPPGYSYGQQNWNWIWGQNGRNLGNNYYPNTPSGQYGSWLNQQDPSHPELLFPNNAPAARNYQNMLSAGMSWDDVQNQMRKDQLLSFYGNPTEGGLRHDPYLSPVGALGEGEGAPGLDEFGFTRSGRLPIWQIAPDMQFLAERQASIRNARLGEQALGSLQQGLANLESYRPGGAAAMMSGYYQGMANTYLSMRQSAPDLLFQYDIHMGTEANRDARRAATLSMTGDIIAGAGNIGGAAIGSFGGGSSGSSASGSTVLPGSSNTRRAQPFATRREKEEMDKEATKGLVSQGIGAVAGMVASYYSGGQLGGTVSEMAEGDSYNALSAAMGDEEDITYGKGHPMFAASGKTVQPDSGGTTITVAEAGEAEHIVPDSKKMEFAQEVQRQAGQPSPSGPSQPNRGGQQQQQQEMMPQGITPAPPTPGMQGFANSLVQNGQMDPVTAMEFTYGAVVDTVGMNQYIDRVDQRLNQLLGV